jgi:uncharacterized protein (DUF2141 family)
MLITNTISGGVNAVAITATPSTDNGFSAALDAATQSSGSGTSVATGTLLSATSYAMVTNVTATKLPTPYSQGDINGDGTIDESDLDLLQANFGRTTNLVKDAQGRIIGDLNGDGVVNISDFNILASNYGKTFPTAASNYAQGDLNGDGTVDKNDLKLVIDNYGGSKKDAQGRVIGDVNGDGKVDFSDLGIVLTHFGQHFDTAAGSAPYNVDAQYGDFNGDGKVDKQDLKILADNYNGTKTDASGRVIGDANGDGKTDFNDLLIVAQNFNQSDTDLIAKLHPTSAGWQEGDLNGDGKIDQSDLDLLKANFNRTSNQVTDQYGHVYGDLNGDGIVNGTDLSILAQHYGQTVASLPIHPIPHPIIKVNETQPDNSASETAALTIIASGSAGNSVANVSTAAPIVAPADALAKASNSYLKNWSSMNQQQQSELDMMDTVSKPAHKHK